MTLLVDVTRASPMAAQRLTVNALYLHDSVSGESRIDNNHRGYVGGGYPSQPRMPVAHVPHVSAGLYASDGGGGGVRECVRVPTSIPLPANLDLATWQQQCGRQAGQTLAAAAV